MRTYRTGDPPHDAGRANPYRELLAQGPPSTRPQGDGGPSPADGPVTPDGGRSPAGGPAAPDGAGSRYGSAPPADGAPPGARPGGPGAKVTGGTGHRPGARHEVEVVLPGELSPRRPATPARPAATATPAVPSRPAGAGSDAVPPGPADPRTQPARRRRRPARPRRFRRFYKSAAWLVFGLGIGGFFLAGVAIDRLGAWDHEVPLQEDTALSFPRSEERWIWLPEEHMGDIVCTGTDGGGANLPMRPALGYDHDDYSSRFRFPTGDGSVTLRCDAAPAPATAGWPGGAETVRVAEPVDRSRDVPFLQAAFIVTLGGPALGVLMFVGTLLTQIVTGIAGLVAKVRRKRERRRQPSTRAGSR